MLKRILFAWFTANFVIIGVVSLLAGSYYLDWPPLQAMLAELGFIMLPNLVFPVVVLRYCWPFPAGKIRDSFGWRWTGWRAFIAGVAGFGLYQGASTLISKGIGWGIPYSQPRNSGALESAGGFAALGLLVLLVAFVVLTVTAEETMFRGWIQTQVGNRYGLLAGFLLSVLLFSLRHLPADLYYSQVWHATIRMWTARQLDLYTGAALLGTTRYFGRSTYAPALMHVLILIVNLFFS